MWASMTKQTFKDFLEEEALDESSDFERIRKLRELIKQNRPGAQEKLDTLIDTLHKRKALVGAVKQAADDYAKWKEDFRKRRGEHQSKRDQDFKNASAEVEAGDNPEKGSAAWRKETGSVRAGPKGSQGTIGTRGTV